MKKARCGCPTDGEFIYHRKGCVVTKLATALVEEDTCPRCLGELDTGWECNECGYDAGGVRKGIDP